MITNDILYVGVNDRDIDLFEGQYIVPNGMAYNSYVICDEKIAIMDTVDKRKQEEYMANLDKALNGKSPDYLIVSHVEPDHASSVKALLDKYPQTVPVGNAKTFQMLAQYFDLDLNHALTIKEGIPFPLGSMSSASSWLPWCTGRKSCSLMTVMTRCCSVQTLLESSALWTPMKAGSAKPEDITLIL